MAVLALTLLRPTLPRWVDRQNVVFLLDVSDSVSLAARERAYRFVSESLRGMKNGDRQSVIVFGEQAVVDQPLSTRPTVDRPKAQVSGRGTNIFQAIQLALATLPPGHANRIVMLTDGRQNAGNALTGAQAAKNAGADLYYVAAPLTFTQEVVAESMVLPQEVKFGEPFQAKVVAWSHKETQGRRLAVPQRRVPRLADRAAQPPARTCSATASRSTRAASTSIRRRSRSTATPSRTTTARWAPSWCAAGPRCWWPTRTARTRSRSSAALRSQNIEVTVVEPAGIPKDMAGLQKYDGVVLSNVSSLKLTRPQMTQIRDYVRDYGGGLMMLGGEESFGLGGYYRTPIEEALPVTMEVKQKVEIPSLAVVLSIDRSGSMAMSTDEKVTKLDLAKEAAHLVVDLLDERNEVGVMSWDTEFIWDATVRSAKDKAAIHHAIATIKAGGGTDGYPALKESYAVLFDRPALLKHVIFLSDGQMTRGDFQGLLRRMSKDKITVSTVAIGKDADVQLMVDVAKWGRGRFYYTEDSQTIPRIFTLETQLASKASLIEQPFKPQLTAPVPRGDAGDRLEGRAAARGLRGHLAQAHRRAGPHEPSGGSGPRHLAVRPRAVRRLHLRRQGQVGGALAALARLQQVLGPAHALDPAQRHPERHDRHRAAAGHDRRGGGRRRRRQGRLHQLHRLPGRRGGAQPGADGHRSRADRARASTVAASRPARRASTWWAWPSGRASA